MNFFLGKLSEWQKDKYCIISFVPSIVKIIEMENRIVVAKGREGLWAGELLSGGYRVIV